MFNILEFLKSNWKWIALIVFILIVSIRVKVRGFFWKIKKTGEELTFTQFLGRWKKGISGITPLQIQKGKVTGNFINFVGLLSGLITMLVVRIKSVWWWASISIAAGLLLVILGQIGELQKLWILRRVEEEQRKIMEDLEVPKPEEVSQENVI